MPVITPLLILEGVLKYGPSFVSLIVKLRDDIAAGKGDNPVTDADWTELLRLSAQTADDIYQRLGIAPPKPPAGV